MRDGRLTQILEAMLGGSLLYLMSAGLPTEYASALRRPRLVRLHGRPEKEIDHHLWALLASWAGSRLLTGDRLLVENAPEAGLAVTPRDW